MHVLQCIKCICTNASSQVSGRCGQVGAAARDRDSVLRTWDRGSGRTRTIHIIPVDFASRCVKRGVFKRMCQGWWRLVLTQLAAAPSCAWGIQTGWNQCGMLGLKTWRTAATQNVNNASLFLTLMWLSGKSLNQSVVGPSPSYTDFPCQTPYFKPTTYVWFTNRTCHFKDPTQTNWRVTTIILHVHPLDHWFWNVCAFARKLSHIAAKWMQTFQELCYLWRMPADSGLWSRVFPVYSRFIPNHCRWHLAGNSHVTRPLIESLLGHVWSAHTRVSGG